MAPLPPLVALTLHTVACAVACWRMHQQALQAREDAAAVRAELCEAREQRAEARVEALAAVAEVRRLREAHAVDVERAVDLERRVGALNRLHLDLVGRVSDEGMLLAGQIYRFRQQIEQETSCEPSTEARPS